MTTYTVHWSDKAQKQLFKLDKSIAGLIVRWVHKNLDDCENPRRHGKALTANPSGKWRYRVGDYRIIAEIHDTEVCILILELGHRKKIYK